jgi:hypothetical protein
MQRLRIHERERLYQIESYTVVIYRSRNTFQTGQNRQPFLTVRPGRRRHGWAGTPTAGTPDNPLQPARCLPPRPSSPPRLTTPNNCQAHPNNRQARPDEIPEMSGKPLHHYTARTSLTAPANNRRPLAAGRDNHKKREHPMLSIRTSDTTAISIKGQLLHIAKRPRTNLTALDIVRSPQRAAAELYCDIHAAWCQRLGVYPRWEDFPSYQLPKMVNEAAELRHQTTQLPFPPAAAEDIAKIIDRATHQLMTEYDHDTTIELVDELCRRLQWRLTEMLSPKCYPTPQPQPKGKGPLP